MYLCSNFYANKEDLRDYEEKLLEKCVNNNYEELNLRNIQTYSPPFICNELI
jgi:hypothetical protein